MDRGASGTSEPSALHARAEDNIRYIRDAMERAGSFTAVPGAGGVAMGVTALAAWPLAERVPGPGDWLVVWLATAAVAATIGVLATIRKAARARTPLGSGPARKFLLALSPAMLAGALVTGALWRAGLVGLLPGVWLLLYGAAVVSGGAFSVPAVPLLGACLMALGAAALFSPEEWGNLYLAAGFGAAQIVFGAVIARKHGG
ncbi:MAG: hypothetical protein ABR576_03870 [Thermoanaerobaculia bacterium]